MLSKIPFTRVRRYSLPYVFSSSLQAPQRKGPRSNTKLYRHIRDGRFGRSSTALRGYHPDRPHFVRHVTQHHLCTKAASSEAHSVPSDHSFDIPPGPLSSGDVEALVLRRGLHKVVTVPALEVPAAATGKLLKQLGPHLLRATHTRTRVARRKGDDDAPGGPTRLLLLREEYAHLPQQQLPAEVQAALADSSCSPRLTTHEVVCGYAHLSAEEVLCGLLPAGLTVPSAFEQVGHIAHMNLQPEHHPYRHLIGRVVLDKNASRIATVVNKTGATGGQYRVFDMAVVAGEHRLQTRLVENGSTFDLDFSKVYWNSRQNGERERLLGELRRGEVLCDVCAGVGPITVPAAKICARVFANDLNPVAAVYLRRNAALNHVQGKVEVSCMDGGAFLAQCAGTQRMRPDHMVMNLPSAAVEGLLPALRGAFPEKLWGGRRLPLVHVYTFVQAEGAVQEAWARISAALGEAIGADPEAHARPVRNVAPGKYIVRASFRLPASVAFALE